MSLLLETNPLREGLPREQVVDPFVLILFGATGDLTRRKLMPALFSLYCQGLLPAGFAVIGVARSRYSDDEYRDHIHSALQESGALGQTKCAWEDFAAGLHYVSGDYDHPEVYQRLLDKSEAIDKERGTTGNRLFYLAIPPEGVSDIVSGLSESRLAHGEKGWTRLVVEKPFGHDLESARNLNKELLRVFNESQIYRIDHYLGKETVQNILVSRFANSIFEPLWNQKYIDHVQITIAETLGVEGRGAYYDKAGALKDIVQNHALQILSLIAMEPPASLAPNDVRDEKTKVLRNVRRLSERDALGCSVRGQYGPGLLLGEHVPAYREETKVHPNSNTETFAAVELHVDNWRWSGTPFYIRTGKRMCRRSTEIAIQFKQVPDVLFRREKPDQVEPNVMTIKVQPDEGITLRTESKVPGLELMLRPVQMDFRYGSSFGSQAPEAYERLLLDAALGDPSLCARDDAVEECWDILMPILTAWEANPPEDFPNYVPGTWGPEASFGLLERTGRKWRRI
jgi:glucose-6-phosphate 1-dehydrogenase